MTQCENCLGFKTVTKFNFIPFIYNITYNLLQNTYLPSKCIY